MTNNEDADYLYACEMQKRLNSQMDKDIEEVHFKPPKTASHPARKTLIKRSNPHSNLDEDFLNRTQNLVHPQWETLDPTPDIFSLFGAFDGRFFQGRLKCVTLEWSTRMYSCAGICYSRRNKFGMDVTIRLSEPLLKLRPRKDLIETMLHEMIHAYCFVLNIREGNGGHGPNFKKIMVGINKVAGTNITVYHTFHDEVEVYKQHWWRCNGSCQNRSPFFGYVKRTSNRAPSSNDQWWAAHMKACGGTFMKIKGPEQKKLQKKNVSKPAAGEDLRKFFDLTKTPKINSSSASTNNNVLKGPVKSNGGGTMLLNPKTLPAAKKPSTNPSVLPAIAAAFPPTSYPGLSTDPFNMGRITKTTSIVEAGGNLTNVKGLRDLNSMGNSVTAKTSPYADMNGKGYSLTSGKTNNTHPIANSNSNQVDRKHLRDIWAQRFSDNRSSGDVLTVGEIPPNKKPRIDDDESETADATKRRRLSVDEHPSTSAQSQVSAKIESDNIFDDDDDDVIILPNENEVIIAISSDEEDCDAVTPPPRRRLPITSDERQKAIKQEILDETCDLKDEDIILIDDEYDDDVDLLNISAAAEVADTSVIDEFFGEDTLLREFKVENAVTSSFGYDKKLREVCSDPQQEIITCAICQGKMQRCDLAEHLNGCTGIAITVQPPKRWPRKTTTKKSEIIKPKAKAVTKKVKTSNAGYSEVDLANLSSTSDDSLILSSSPPSSSMIINLSDDENNRRHRQRGLFTTKRQCPACGREFEPENMDNHLAFCTSDASEDDHLAYRTSDASEDDHLANCTSDVSDED